MQFLQMKHYAWQDKQVKKDLTDFQGGLHFQLEVSFASDTVALFAPPGLLALLVVPPQAMPLVTSELFL